MKQKLLASLYYILPHHAISRVMFVIARIRWRPLKNLIIRIYTSLVPVNLHEAVEEDRFAYESLNAFFTRAIKAEYRPFDENQENWLCPVDGAVSQAQAIKDGRIFQAKGHDYSLLELVGADKNLASVFSNGTFATLYLSPRDYHRIHMPTTGTLQQMVYVPGRLFSVAPFTVNNIPRLFARNERCVCYFETEQGPMAMILVGAINVAATETVWHGLVTGEASNINSGEITQFDYRDKYIVLKRGEEMGRFNLGSTVIVLATDKMKLDKSIVADTEIKLGQCLARPDSKTID